MAPATVRTRRCHSRTESTSGQAGGVQPEQDWLRVVAQQRCETCGLAASAVDKGDLPAQMRLEAVAWARLLRRTDVEALRRRPRPEVWSALEYGAHVRDVVAVFTERIGRVLTEPQPTFGWWDHDAAVIAERYNEDRPDDVASSIEANADSLAAVLSGVPTTDWSRMGTRRDGETLTVAAFARFALHEVRHHRYDAEASILG
jgi:hypothetical protein